MWCQGKRKGFSFDPVLAQFHTFLVVVLNVAFDGVVWMNKALLLSHEKKEDSCFNSGYVSHHREGPK